MWITYLIFAIVELTCLACIIVGAYDAGRQKEKGEKIKDLSRLLWMVGGLILLISTPFFPLIVWDSARRTALRKHLNEPITSEMQLYGYKILDKRHFKEKTSFDNPEESRYLIDILDLLPSYSGAFIDVKVSEEFYNEKAKRGEFYLQENDPNAPALAPALQDQ